MCRRTAPACSISTVSSSQAFDGLRDSGRRARRPEANICVPDHNVPTTPGRGGIEEIDNEESRIQLEVLKKNAEEFGLPYFEVNDIRQGIVHVIGPEQGFTQPGLTIVCGDSHTATHGAFGALAFGIGTSEVEHVLATQTLIQRPAKNMRITVNGAMPFGCTAKDLILAIIGKIGTAGGTGHVIEYAGEAIRDLSMEGRMTVCNMSIEAGARAGLIAPDQVTFDYLAQTPRAPHGDEFARAVARWRELHSDDGAQFDREVRIDARDIHPTVTWGTHPGQVAAVDARLPRARDADADKALAYMGFDGGAPLLGHPVDVVFVGSCTNARLSDLRQVAGLLRGRRLHPRVRMLVVPGSEQVKRAAEAEGIDRIVRAAGGEWREAGCSMCIAMNGDLVGAGQLAVSTSNRNFEGRQGKGARTVLASPLIAAACAVAGEITDPRKFLAEAIEREVA